MGEPSVQALRYRARFEQSRLPQLETDVAGRLALVNDALCALVGLTREQILGRPASVLNHPDDTGAADAHLASLLAGEVDWAQYQRVLRAADGSAVPVHVDVSLLRDERGQPAGAASHYQDLRPLHEGERRRLRQQELYAALERLSREMALVADAEGTLLYASPVVTTLLGYDSADLTSRDGYDFVHPDDLEHVQGEFAAVVGNGGTRTWLLRVSTADGRWLWVEQTASNLLDTGIGGIVSTLRDVTRRVEAEQALRASELRYRSIAETAQEGMLAVTTDGRTIFANERMAAILGVALEQLYSGNPLDLLTPDVAETIALRMRTREQRGPERYEIRYLHPDGTMRDLLVSTSPLPALEDAEPGSLAMVADITELRRNERELAAAALRDGLTGLPNRALLTDRLERTLARGSTALIVIDLDHLQLLNEAYGHRLVDDLLVAVGERLLELAQPADTVARMGGDEFALVCEGCDGAQAMERAHELLGSLASAFDVGGEVLHVTGSIGVAESASVDGADGLLRAAGTAAYAAKAAGRNRVQLFDPAMAEHLSQRSSTATELRTALERDALTLQHQPVVDLRTGQVVGIEALVRWSREASGAVDTEQLLSVALMTGIAADLDRWVLDRALTEFGQLRSDGRIPPDAYVAVNLSAGSVAELRLDQELAGWAAAHAVAPHQVVLELTETEVLPAALRSEPALGRLREQGFGIALDDFGTGYASLGSLRDLPVTALKIDGSFVRDLTVDADAHAIVASIVDLARAVGITAVAEGVESLDQLALLRRLGCGHAQGRLWSPPLAASEIPTSGAWSRPFETAAPAANASSLRPGPPVEPEVRPEHGLDRLLDLHREGASLATVAAALNSEGFRTPTGLRWHRTSVARVVATSAYPGLITRS